MKKEYIYIIILLLALVAGVLYKNIFVLDKYNKTQELITEYNDLSSKFKRDSLIQANNNNIQSVYHENLRDEDKTFDRMNTEILTIIERKLIASGIKYESNKLIQSKLETLQKRNNLEFFHINLEFKTQYTNLLKFILNLEKDRNLIDIIRLSVENRDNEFSFRKKINKTDLLNIEMELQLTKFIN